MASTSGKGNIYSVEIKGAQGRSNSTPSLPFSREGHSCRLKAAMESLCVTTAGQWNEHWAFCMIHSFSLSSLNIAGSISTVFLMDTVVHRAIPQASSPIFSCAVCALNLSLTSGLISFHTLPVFVVHDGFYTTIRWGSSRQQGDM